jgi:hypothetical protein
MRLGILGRDDVRMERGWVEKWDFEGFNGSLFVSDF